jgi:hypothetical protein
MTDTITLQNIDISSWDTLYRKQIAEENRRSVEYEMLTGVLEDSFVKMLTGVLKDSFVKMFCGTLNKGFTITSLILIEFFTLLLGCDNLIF